MDKTKQAIAVFDKHAEAYQEKFMDVSLYHEALDLFCKHLPVKNAQVLDLACGPGNITNYLLAKERGLKLLGTDLSQRMLQLAKKNNPGVEFRLLDARKVRDLQMNFDGIICGFCLPYLSKAEAIQLIADVSFVLNKAGVFYLSTMEDDNNKSGIEKNSSGDEVFMNYHEAGYLVKALEDQAFTVVDLQRKHYVYQNKQTTDLLIVAKK